jgi:hypothetical protein
MPRGLATKLVSPLRTGGILYFYPTSTADDVINVFKGIDPASLTKLAKVIARGAWYDNETDTGFTLVAPGLPWTEAFFLKAGGFGCPLVLFLIFLTCALWSLVLLNLHELARSSMGRIASYLAPLLLCLSGVFQGYILRAGLVMTEPISVALLSLSILLMIRCIVARRLSMGIWSGSMLALAAYFRGQTEIVAVALTFTVGIAISWQLLVFFSAVRRLPSSALALLQDKVLTVDKHFVATAVLICVATFHCLTVPYRIWKLNHPGIHSASWLQADYIWKYYWKNDPEFLASRWGNSWAQLGGNVPAMVDPALASRMRETLHKHGEHALPDSFFKWRTITTFLRHPIEWIALKARIWPNFWFEPDFCGLQDNRPLVLCNCEDILFLLLVLFSTVRFVVIPCIKRTIYADDGAYFFFYSSLLAEEAVLFIFSHFEERYCYTIKLATLVMVLAFLFERIKWKPSTAKTKVPEVEPAIRQTVDVASP